MKPGYIYVLAHPSDLSLYKVGITIREPEHRLREHNSNYSEYTGKIVKETGQKWALKEFHPVPDPYWAEAIFWRSTPYANIPYRYGVEVGRMSWDVVERGLSAARSAGIRPGPGPVPDHVYAYTASIRRRLSGRGITLLGHVKSLSGKAEFRCSNGHEWRTTPSLVGEGQGCPMCGVGHRDPKKIREEINAGVVYLLRHPDMPGFVKIGLSDGESEEVDLESSGNDWEIHRFRNVENVAMAESLIWELLGEPLPHDRQPIRMDLREAEAAFRKLIYAIQSEMALEERAREAV